LVGVAATAPPTRLHQLFQDNLDRLSRPHPSLSKGVTPLLMKLYDETQEKVISAYILAAWSEVYGTPFESVLAPPAESVVDRVAKRCAEDSLGSLMITLTSQLANDDFLKELDLSKKPWPEYLARNSPSSKLPNVPLYILQGTADQTVDPSVSAEYAKMACANSVPVRFSWLVGVSHEGAGFFSTDDVVDWMTDRFAGKPPSDMCGKLPPLPDPPPPGTPIAGRTG